MSSDDRSTLTRREMLAISGLGGASLALGAVHAQTPADARGNRTLETRVTRELGVRLPFVGAGMGFIALPDLVAAVTNAGGLGVLGAGIESPDGTRTLIRSIRAKTSGPFGVDFLFDDSALGPLVTDAHVETCIDEHVPLVVFHMNVPPRHWVDSLHKAGTKVWMQAGSVEQAQEAHAIGIDAIIAQGTQAGGHNKSITPLFELLAQIIDTVRPRMVLAAGGIADGRSAARALARGADAVWVGTRLVASTEAYAHPEYQRRILGATGESSVITRIFGPEYPDRPFRVLRNRVVREFEKGVPSPPPLGSIGKTVLFPQTTPVPYEMPKFSSLPPTRDTAGDFEEMALPASSESARLIKRIQPAGEIVREMMAEAKEILAREGLVD